MGDFDLGSARVLVTCLKCATTLTKSTAGISTCPRGDEIIYSYLLCPACDHWTVEEYHDEFMGEDWVRTAGPYPRESGERDVAKIRQCPTPHDKMCDCEVHRNW